jgi:CRISPR-associated endonuclease Csy4
MDHYIDIQLKPDAEMRENVLLNKVYTKLHKALFDLNSTSIGVSFPDYQLRLGCLLRLHGNSADLLMLQAQNWLGGLAGYCDVTGVQKIPTLIQHRAISRKQSNMTKAKLNRLLRRGTINLDHVSDYKAKLFSNSLENPFVELDSTSNGHRHRRYIQFGDLKNEPTFGQFDFFGLSKNATVPWF